ncbi:uncharacterized protein LOC128217145 isoform X1 [Mya arenaria]|uniref:uncharacterized protein LOC128217145 isoform X1 n=1 Tax=Mya arenaria TaxID=6604 RepID=UPI0022E5C866|nr:uncharacterized protein LOC128217145 isoform X1 [Mya arenaria]XP_052780028.1 uncharacterized protein LOC128217145 isoform X1 [Mya arenaria]
MEQKPSEIYSGFRQEKSENQKIDLESRNLKFFKEDIFQVPYEKLSDSSNYKHFQHVFVDSDDYEDFKQDLVNFHHLRSRWKDDRRKVSKERPSRLNSLVDDSDIIKFRESKGIDSSLKKELEGLCGEGEHIYEEIDDVKKEVEKLKAKELKNTEPKAKCEGDCDCLDFALESLPMMEFFQNDEHFLEFDRVFETVKNKRRYASSSSLDKYRWSPHSEGHKSDDSSSDTDTENEDGGEEFPELKVDDIFADFFDNDADFKDFEKEFENFQFKRRSNCLERWHRNSVCDLVEDLKAFCDKDEQNGSNKENKLSLPKLWNQGGEWDYIFNKICQNGKVPSVNSDTCRSDLTVTCDSESGNYLLDDVSDVSNRDTGYYSEAKFNGDTPETCTCQQQSKSDCQYTCHHQCLPSIQLECKCMSHDQEDEGTVLSGETTLADLAASSQSAEQSEPASEKDETDSGYRSGTIPDEKLPPKPSDATLNREELKKRISEFNKLVQGANFALLDPDRAFNDEEASDCQTEPFQGFIKVVLNLVRPISMSLGARPPSIYEVLTQEHIVEHNTQNISFYMPRDTVRSIHAHSTQSTKEVISLLLKKFHILDHPRKFALYEQELKNNKIARIRRVKDIESPLAICLSWEFENIHNHRLVLQENETGEIDWEAFCVPELNNFLRVLDREQDEYMAQLRYKYKVMKRLILQRMKELRLETERQKRASVVGDESTS